jgi:hypothetical protein
VGPVHARNAVPVKKAVKALSAWVKASGRLRLALGATSTSAPTLTKEQIVKRFCTEASARRMGKMNPLSFAQYVVETAMGATQFAIAETENHQISGDLERDLWRAWVAYLAQIGRQLGIRVSAASSNKGNKESPFVRGVIFLQERLPKECRRFSGYSSVVKGVQEAVKFEQSPKTLLAILAGWGVGLHALGEYNLSVSEARVTDLLRGNNTQKKASLTSRPS